MPSPKVRARQQATANAIIEAAVAVMAEFGAAGLSLGEVARRVGMRTPSLYEYFDSRAALCDEVFRRGWTMFGQLADGIDVARETDLAHLLETSLRQGVAWALGHRAYAELMFWRPIPHWQPAPDAFAPAVATLASLGSLFRDAQRAELLRNDVETEELVQVWSALTTGVISQQLSNEPDIDPDQGRASRYAPTLVAMFIHHYGPQEGS